MHSSLPRQLVGNRKVGRRGHVFQGRFKANLIDGNGSWLLLASVYLHLNPVRTAEMGLDKRGNRAEARGLRPADGSAIKRRLAKLKTSKWSSYGAYCGYVAKPNWLQTKAILARAGGKTKYRKYVHSYVTRGDNPVEFETLKGRLIIGGVAFVEQMKKMTSGVTREHAGHGAVAPQIPLEEIVTIVAAEKGERWEDFKGRRGDWGKPLVLYLARKRSGRTLAEIGDWVGEMEYKAVSKAVERFRKKIDEDKALMKVTKRCLSQMSTVET